jgi:hypothetical protein
LAQCSNTRAELQGTLRDVGADLAEAEQRDWPTVQRFRFVGIGLDDCS